ncbi:GAK system CofD-like protein [Desulfovibrio inopinatus]|uniref:GAK system CofD-like protein n=1 Tax=Desulfovibrio inopinatus TaxID=102109 RepID=UPI00042265C0|nr:GAK system CofD-like protein [Desulfovibrio inopinatus]
MQKIAITRTVTLPNKYALARYRKAPELGLHVLFFTGGTALKDLSREIIHYTHKSYHLITPFDSGGSSAVLRKAFHMPAVGDLRNRIMALADRTIQGNPEIYDLFAFRLPKDASQEENAERLHKMQQGRDSLVNVIPDPMRKIIRTHLRFFREAMPAHFNLAGASIGNLILTGGYLNYNRQIDPVLFLFSRLVEARGVVRPIVNKDLTLMSELEDGTVLAGQHLLTGKELGVISSPVKRMWISKSQTNIEPVSVEIRRKIKDIIAKADIICYPMGSLYSSILANLMPIGVGSSIAKNDCPKVYIPNTGNDPESLGLSVPDCVEKILGTLRESAGDPDIPADKLLNFVLLDEDLSHYSEPFKTSHIERLGVNVVQAPLVVAQSAPYLDSIAIIDHILSLA